MQRTGRVDHAARTQCLEKKWNRKNSPPMNGWKNEIKNNGWWLMKITVV